MVRSDPDLGPRIAATELWKLLWDDARYRDVWKRVARAEHLRVVNGKVNVEAVRRLIVDHLWEAGELGSDPRSLENRHRRPWKGQVFGVANGIRLSTRTLETFIAAFNITDRDADRLRGLHAGDEVDHR